LTQTIESGASDLLGPRNQLWDELEVSIYTEKSRIRVFKEAPLFNASLR